MTTSCVQPGSHLKNEKQINQVFLWFQEKLGIVLIASEGIYLTDLRTCSKYPILEKFRILK
jgi:hypothetical protein